MSENKTLKKAKSVAGRLPFLLVAVLIGLLSWLAPASAQQKFSGTVFFDYTFYLSNDGPITTPPTNNPNFKNNFMNFRRVYFRYDNKINDNISFRLTLDGDTVKAVDSSGKADDKFRPYLKHMYLQVNNLVPDADIKIGMADTITFKLAEDRWGYRSVAKTLLDGYKDITGKDIDATSADIGISLSGKLLRQVRYGVMLSSGEGYSKPEKDKHKKLSSFIQLIPVAGFSVVGYIDYEKQDVGARAYTYKGDVYVEFIPNLTLGAEYFVYRNDKNLLDGQRYDRSGLSVFGRYNLIPEKLNLFARFDRYEPSDLTDLDEISLIIAGLDWAPLHSSFKLQPNIWVYDYKDLLKKNDLIFNLTFLMSF
ncbi:MAG: hypothetical protein QHH43_04040 [Candidatus Saccharicenans sp.]|nr:hypothetical protein [Candidatus Saccharicenans sp.]MDH7574913.1 hypothetical protein [Candidatus Saccharicenans sp.]